MFFCLGLQIIYIYYLKLLYVFPILKRILPSLIKPTPFKGYNAAFLLVFSVILKIVFVVLNSVLLIFLTKKKITICLVPCFSIYFIYFFFHFTCRKIYKVQNKPLDIELVKRNCKVIYRII